MRKSGVPTKGSVVLLRARQQGPWVIAIFWFVSVCVGTLVTVFPQQMLAALLVVVAVGLMRLLPLAPSLLSPTRLVVGGWQLLAAGGLLYPHVAGAGAAGISAQLELDPASAQSTIRLLLVAAFAVAAGAGLLTLTRVLLRRPLLYHRSAGLRPVTLPPSTQGWLLAGLLALPVAQVLTVGVMPLLKRPDYLFIGHGSTGSLAMLTAAAAVVCLGHLWAVRCHRPLLAGLCGWQFAVTFALSSRLLALLPPLFALGFASANPKRGKPLLAIAAWVGILLVRVPLATRSLPEHGLLPYLHHLPTLFTTGWAPTAANLLFGFANIGCTAFASPLLPVHDLLVAINPLPGGIAGWYAIASAHRINLFTPYAALGELGNHGWLVLVGYCLVVGAILGHLDNSVRQLLAGGRQAYGLALIALAGLFMVISTQYNLRTATRLMYYALAADVAIRLWLRFGPERFRS